MRSNVYIAFVSGLSAALAACGGHDDGGRGSQQTGRPVAPIAKSELPAAVASAMCEALAPCCADAGTPIDPDQCETMFSFALADGIAAADPGKYTYDPERAAACVRALHEIDACTGEAESSMRNGFCADAFAGTVAPGGACVASMECELPADGEGGCVQQPDGGRRCLVKPTAAEGEPCYWTCTRKPGSVSCVARSPGDVEPSEQPRCFTGDGLYCSPAGTCAALAGLGAPCEGDEACGEGLFCESASRTCRALLERGQACSVEGCAEGLFCKDGACAPLIATGTACQPFMDECEDGGACPPEGVCGESEDLRDLGIGLVCALAGA